MAKGLLSILAVVVFISAHGQLAADETLELLGRSVANRECPSKEAAERRPNVIVFMIDDLGWTDAGCYGSDLYETPNIDRLAANGIRFTNAYAACTVCSPTRAAMMTGMYPARLNVTDWIDGMWEHLSPQRQSKHPLMPPEWTKKLEHRYTTLPESLKAAGYKTAHVGKWHLTPRSPEESVVEPFYPENQGFNVNIAGNQWGAPGSYYWPYRRARQQSDIEARVANFPNSERTKGKYLTDMLTDEAVSIIQRWQDESFFLYFAHYAVHTPIQGRKDLTEKYAAKINPKHKHRNAEYAAMVESVDHSVGRVLGTLKQLDILDNTVIVYTSDNGGLVRLKNGPTNNTPLRAGKGSPYEGGVRIPTIISWPDVVSKGSVSDEPIITCDFYPTILEITQAMGDANHNANVDGVSLVPILKQSAEPLGREAIYWHYPHYHSGGSTPYSAVRAGPWRLVEFYEDAHVELYNLADDIGEKNELSKKHQKKAKELTKMLHRWRERVKAQPPRANRNFKPVRQPK